MRFAQAHVLPHDHHSVWTIDLAHLLRRFGLHVVFLTVTLGAHPEYCNEQFYMECLDEDTCRVQKLFQVRCAR